MIVQLLLQGLLFLVSCGTAVLAAVELAHDSIFIAARANVDADRDEIEAEEKRLVRAWSVGLMPAMAVLAMVYASFLIGRVAGRDPLEFGIFLTAVFVAIGIVVWPALIFKFAPEGMPLPTPFSHKLAIWLERRFGFEKPMVILLVRSTAFVAILGVFVSTLTVQSLALVGS